jgi:hypothetical protein
MKATLTGLLLLGALVVGGCGGDDDEGGGSDPLSNCKKAVAEICSKFYGCLTDAELDAIRAFVPGVGNNEADCRTGFEGDSCSEQMLKCDSGTTYSAAKANECISQYKSLSCDEFADPATMTPAACEQTCQ